MIIPHFSKYWIDLFDNVDNANDDSEDSDGFWVVFLRENIWQDTKFRMNFLNHLAKYMNQFRIPFIRVSSPYYDRLIVFTSCAKREIKNIQISLQQYFGFDNKNMIWKANFESTDSWDKTGWLYSMNATLVAFENCIPKNKRNTQKFKRAIFSRSETYQKILEETIMQRKSMVVQPIFGNINYDLIKNSVFIIMPFSESWSDDICKCIKEVCVKQGIIATRGDDFMTPGVILDDIWKGINESELIIADITVHNANVFYELGIAHTLGKDVILLHQKDGEKVPFDINNRRYVSYGLLPSEFEKFKKDLNLVVKNFFGKDSMF